MSSKVKQLIVLNFATLLIGTSGPLGRAILLPADYNIFLRCVLAVVIIYTIIRFSSTPHRIHSRNDLFKFIISGLLLCGHWVFYFMSLKVASVSIGVLSLFTFPVMTTLLEPLFFKTKIHWITLANSLLIIIGIYTLVPEFNLSNNNTIGVLWGLISALFYALRNLINKTIISTYSGTVIMFYQVLVSTIILTYTLFTTPIIQPTGIDIIHIIILSLLTTSIGHILFVKSLRHFNTSTASIVSSMQPIYGIILGVIYLGESPNFSVFIGGLMILITVLLQSVVEIRSGS